MFQVVRNSPKPLGDQLVEEVSRLIESGRLPEGFRLPSVRQLARRAGVSAYTVTTAFQRLSAKGLIQARAGSGYFVARIRRQAARVELGPAPSLDPVLGFTRNLLEQEECEEEARAGFDGVPAGEHAERCENAGEDDEPHREAVDAEMIADGGVGDPVGVLLELETAEAGVVEVRGQMQREGQCEQGHDESDDVVQLRVLSSVWDERDDDRADQRCEKKQREDGMIEVHRVTVMVACAGWTTKRTMAMTAAAPSASQPA